MLLFSWCFMFFFFCVLRAALLRRDRPDSGGGGFKAYFEEIAMVLKRHFPDVIIDREIVEVRTYH